MLVLQDNKTIAFIKIIHKISVPTFDRNQNPHLDGCFYNTISMDREVSRIFQYPLTNLLSAQ